MSNIYKLPRRDELIDQASDWLAKLDRGLSAEEEKQIEAWLVEDSTNRKTLLKIATLWDKMDSLSQLTSMFPQPINNPNKVSSRTFVAVAALLLIVVLAGFLTVYNVDVMKNSEPSIVTNQRVEQRYQTNVGEQSTITLFDGSQLILNTNSLLIVRFSDKQRNVYLQRGEVYVQVEKDANRPFNVHIGSNLVQAVGTEFNLEIIDDKQIELIISEGKVRVDASNSHHNTLLMSEGDTIMLGSPGEKIQQISEDEIKVKLSWRSGNLIFHGESLQKAITEIERYTHVKFEILDESLKQVRVAGLFKAGDVNGLLETLKQNFNVTYQRVGTEKIMLSSMNDEL